MQPARIAYASCPLCGDAVILDLREVDCTRHPLYQPALPATIGWCSCHRCGHVFAEGFESSIRLGGQVFLIESARLIP